MRSIFSTTQRRLLYEATYPDLSEVKTTPDIEEAERMWAGGIADFGDLRAARIIQRLPGYKAYRKSLVAAVRKHLGSRFTLYRAMPEKAVHEWIDEGSPSVSYSSFTTALRVARAWTRYAGHHAGVKQVVIRAAIEPDFVVMRGKAAESELVVNNHHIDSSTIEVV